MLVHQRTARTCAPYPRLFSIRQPNLERGDDVLRYPVLKREHVVEVALETVGPHMAAVQAVDQLCRQSYAIAGLADAPLQHMADAERSPDFADVSRVSPEHKTRIASDNQQFRNLRQRRQYVFSDTVGKILLLGIAAHILKRQDGDGGLVRERGRLLGLGSGG